MPMPYSHYVLAQSIAREAGLILEDKSAYLVAAFMPDIRYFTQQPRDKYHFSVQQLERYRDATSEDYLLGYGVHLLIDEVWEDSDIKTAYKNSFPPIIQKRLTRGLQALTLEMYCLTQPVDVVELKPVENGLTKALEISSTDIERAVASMQRYLEQHNLAAALEMAKETKLFPDERLQTVERVVKLVKNPLVRPVVYGMINRASSQVFPKIITQGVSRLGELSFDQSRSSEREHATFR